MKTELLFKTTEATALPPILLYLTTTFTGGAGGVLSPPVGTASASARATLMRP